MREVNSTDEWDIGQLSMLTIGEAKWYSKDGMHIDPKYYCGSPFSFGAELDNDWIVD